jgi:hypothetical protein
MMKSLSAALASASMWSGILMCAGFLVGDVPPAKAQQYSADLVLTRDDKEMPAGRLWVSDARVRIETPEFPNAFFLVDVSQPSAYFVRPAMHVYMEARQSSRLTRLFVPVDPNQPCARWQAMAQLAGVAGQGDWRCERGGEEVIDGRNTIVFRVFFGRGQEFLGCIDPVRKFPLRIRMEDGTSIVLQNIRDGAQPATSFELPRDLRKFSPEALVEQIRQSDVWVGEPGGGAGEHR